MIKKGISFILIFAVFTQTLLCTAFADDSGLSAGESTDIATIDIEKIRESIEWEKLPKFKSVSEDDEESEEETADVEEAETTENPVEESEENEAVPDTAEHEQLLLDEITSGAAVTSGAALEALDGTWVKDNYYQYSKVASDGSTYLLTVKCDFSLCGDTDCGQITNVSKDVNSDIVVDSYITISKDGDKKEIKIVSIGAQAFEGCKATSITLPETVHDIGSKAFYSCPELESITAPGVIYDTEDVGNINISGNRNYAKIDSYAFAECPKLETANLSGFVKMGNNIFENCVSLKEVNFSLENMPRNAGTGKTISQYKATMGDACLKGCTSLKYFSISRNVTSVGNEFFVNCAALEQVDISESFEDKSFDASVFDGCTNMKKVYVQGEDSDPSLANSGDNIWNRKFMSKDGVLYKILSSYNDYDEETGREIKTYMYNELIYYPQQKPDTEFTVPRTVTSIGVSAVKNNKWLKTLNINSYLLAVTTLGEVERKYQTIYTNSYAFSNCDSLQTVNIENICSLGSYTFSGCDSLVKLNHSYTEGSDKFYGKSQIGSYAFEKCSSFDGKDIKGWSSIGKYAFTECPAIIDANLIDCGTINDYAFYKCVNMRSADLSQSNGTPGDGVGQYSFGAYIFKDCSSLKNVKLMVNLLGLSTGTFENCISLESVECGNYIGTIESRAFYNCRALKYVSEIRFLVTIKANAFYGCTALKELNLTRSVMNIDDSAFVGCPSLIICAPENSRAYEFAVGKQTALKAAVDDIQDYEFLVYDIVNKGIYYDPETLAKTTCYRFELTGYRGGFETLTIPPLVSDDVTGLAAYACLQSPYMADSWISHPESQDSDNSMAKMLTHIDLGGITQIGNYALSYCTELESIEFPKAMSDEECLTYKYRSTTPAYLASDDSNHAEYYWMAIGNSAFSGCSKLTNIVFNEGENPLSIGNKAFSGCNRINEVVLSDNVVFIGKNAFEKCSRLKSVSFSKGLRTIDSYAFSKCSYLEQIRFQSESSLERINSQTFADCIALSVVTFPHNVYIGSKAFAGCNYVSRIVVPHTVVLAVSNDPFCDSKNVTVLCDDFSKAQDYVNYKNENAMNFTMEKTEFIDGLKYVTIKGKLLLPADSSIKVNVLKNGAAFYQNSVCVVDEADNYLIEGDKLTISAVASPDKLVSFTVNGKKIADGGEYIVKENENVTVLIESAAKGKITIPENVIVMRGNQRLANQSYLTPGDVLNITAASSDGTPFNLYVNGLNIGESKSYTVKDNNDVLVEIVYGMKYEYGDVNMDTSLMTNDVTYTLAYVLDSINTPFTEEQKVLAAVMNGVDISAADVTAILAKVLDSSYVFPILK